MTTVDLDAYHARLTAVDEDVLRCGCEVQCDTAHDDYGTDEDTLRDWALEDGRVIP